MSQTIGKITVAPEVLLTIVRFSTLSQPGVKRLASRVPSRVGPRLRAKTAADRGIAILVQDNRVIADVHIVANGTVSLHELATSLQCRIADAIEEMVGMPVDAVHIFVDDVETSGPESESP